MKALFQGREESLVGRICGVIYDLCYWIDQKRGKIDPYSYETAPYCGHHYSGHKGWLTWSDYHESEGDCSAKFLGIVFCITTWSECYIGFASRPPGSKS